MKEVVEHIRQSLKPFLSSSPSSFEEVTFQRKRREAISKMRCSLGNLCKERDEHKSVLAAETLLRLARMNDELKDLVTQRIRFEATETWRATYEDTLCHCKTKRYLSVALVRDDGYWQDTPGQKSIQLNQILVQRGFYVHRILIVEDFFWPRAARLPSTKLNNWIMSQYLNGIQIGLVRLTDLDDEPDLVRDFGDSGLRREDFFVCVGQHSIHRCRK